MQVKVRISRAKVDQVSERRYFNIRVPPLSNREYITHFLQSFEVSLELTEGYQAAVGTSLAVKNC
jgi:hypothetical protein